MSIPESTPAHVPWQPYSRVDIKRESDTRFSTSGFFHESLSPGPPSIPLGPFRIIGGVVVTGDKFIAGDNDTADKFIAGDNDTSEQ
jgi:hypothetical protein